MLREHGHELGTKAVGERPVDQLLARLVEPRGERVVRMHDASALIGDDHV